MLRISLGYWLRHESNPQGDDFFALTGNQLVSGDLFTYALADMWMCVCQWIFVSVIVCDTIRNWMFLNAIIWNPEDYPYTSYLDFKLNSLLFFFFPSALGLWCDGCLCCVPSAWSSRVLCSPYLNHRRSWKVRNWIYMKIQLFRLY